MATAKKTASKKTTAKRTTETKSAEKTTTAPKKAASKKSAAAKKKTLVQEKRSTGDGPACWPGYERVPGTKPGAKGSCEPKPDQTTGEKKADSRAAAGSKLRKAGGNKAKANHTR